MKKKSSKIYNVYLDLPLPTHTTIQFGLFAPLPKTMMEKTLMERAAVVEVERAINAWCYSECGTGEGV